MAIFLFFLVQATFSVDGTIALGTGEVSGITSVLNNAGSSLLTIAMYFFPALIILYIVIKLIKWGLAKIGFGDPYEKYASNPWESSTQAGRGRILRRMGETDEF